MAEFSVSMFEEIPAAEAVEVSEFVRSNVGVMVEETEEMSARRALDIDARGGVVWYSSMIAVILRAMAFAMDDN